MNELDDLLNLELVGDNLHAFRNDWMMILQNLSERPRETELEALFRRQLKKSTKFKPMYDIYTREVLIDHKPRSYERLLTMLDSFFWIPRPSKTTRWRKKNVTNQVLEIFLCTVLQPVLTVDVYVVHGLRAENVREARRVLLTTRQRLKARAKARKVVLLDQSKMVVLPEVDRLHRRPKVKAKAKMDPLLNRQPEVPPLQAYLINLLA